MSGRTRSLDSMDMRLRHYPVVCVGAVDIEKDGVECFCRGDWLSGHGHGVYPSTLTAPSTIHSMARGFDAGHMDYAHWDQDM